MPGPSAQHGPNDSITLRRIFATLPKSPVIFDCCPAAIVAGGLLVKRRFVYVHCFTTPLLALRPCSLRLWLLRDATSRTSVACERASFSNARGSGRFRGPNTLQLALLSPNTCHATIVDEGQGAGECVCSRTGNDFCMGSTAQQMRSVQRQSSSRYD